MIQINLNNLNDIINMISIDFYVPGTPQPLKRHRMTRRGRVYDPSAEDKREWMKVAQSFCPTVPLSGALKVNLEFIMPRPKSHFGTGKNDGKLKPSAPVYHLHTPDLDNLVKFVLDAMNGKFYADDAQIVSIECNKIFSNDKDESGTIVYISSIN
jgi:crossover junction endodeoxyribonuclease RusA